MVVVVVEVVEVVGSQQKVRGAMVAEREYKRSRVTRCSKRCWQKDDWVLFEEPNLSASDTSIADSFFFSLQCKNL